VLTVQIVYQLTLAGDTAVNYSDPFQGHHFWGLDINAVMASGNLPTSITTTETIEIDFYANSTTVLNDPNGQVLTAFIVSAKPGASRQIQP
jgi:hypothetical protein